MCRLSAMQMQARCSIQTTTWQHCRGHPTTGLHTPERALHTPVCCTCVVFGNIRTFFTSEVTSTFSVTIMSKPELSITSCTAADHVDHVHYAADVLKCGTCGITNPHAQALRLLERVAGKPRGALSTRAPKTRKPQKPLLSTDIDTQPESIIDFVKR